MGPCRLLDRDFLEKSDGLTDLVERLFKVLVDGE